MKKIIITAALLVTTLLMAVSCTKQCDVCGENSMGGKEIFGQFVCNGCIEDMGSMFGM